MATPLIDGFRINSEIPIDDRIVANSSVDRDLIAYKYDGLKVFQLDNRIPYIWNKSKYLISGITSSSWDIDDIIVGSGSSNRVALWDTTGSGLTSTTIISEPSSYNESNQKVGLSNTPYESFQIDSNYLTYSSIPLVIHKGINTTIGDNWYYDIVSLRDGVFDSNVASSAIQFKDGGIKLSGRLASGVATMSRILSMDKTISSFTNYISMGETYGSTHSGILSYNSNRIKSGNKNISNVDILYTTIVTQVDTNNPSEILLESTIGSGTWSYVSIGTYNLLTNGFNAVDTHGYCGPHTSSGVFFGSKISNNIYQIKTLDTMGGVLTDGLLYSTFIELRGSNVTTSTTTTTTTMAHNILQMYIVSATGNGDLSNLSLYTANDSLPYDSTQPEPLGKTWSIFASGFTASECPSTPTYIGQVSVTTGSHVYMQIRDNSGSNIYEIYYGGSNICSTQIGSLYTNSHTYGGPGFASTYMMIKNPIQTATHSS